MHKLRRFRHNPRTENEAYKKLIVVYNKKHYHATLQIKAVYNEFKKHMQNIGT